MRKILLCLMMLSFVACTTDPAPMVPTLAALPSATLAPATVIPITQTPVPPTQVAQAGVDTPTLTTVVSATPTATPSATVTLSVTPTLTPTLTETMLPTASQTASLVPSLTITNTITSTPTLTRTATPDVGVLGDLVMLAARATILPPEQLYNPQTLTAVYFAGQNYQLTQIAGTANPFAPTLPPTFGTLPPTAAITCPLPLPGTLALAFSADPALTQSAGCPLTSAPFGTTTAVQAFERGTMLYLQGSPNSIYVLTLDGRFQRFEDTWLSGVDPETGGETAPLGLIVPKRGFGKVWRNNPNVQALLGWGVNEEAGANSSVLLFERGRAISLPQRGDLLFLSDDPGGITGTWRALAASF